MILLSNNKYFFEVQFSLKAFDGWWLTNDKLVSGFGYFKSYERLDSDKYKVSAVQRKLALPLVIFRLIKIEESKNA